MDLTRKTKRGGVVSIHFGKIVTTNLWDKFGWYQITDQDAIDMLCEIRKAVYHGDIVAEQDLVEKLMGKYPLPTLIGVPHRRETKDTIPASKEPDPVVKQGAPAPLEVDQTFKRATAASLIQFFSEFTFNPAIRFANTLANTKSYRNAKTYVSNYMSLCDHPDKDSIVEKIKSDEFRTICENMFKCASGNQVNSRLEIYYGPAGTGKTTAAIAKYPDAKVTVCNENMDSTDLMKTFSFNDENGNPVFKPSVLQEDMIAGRPHILDEINLLPLSSLRYLQGILDGKKEIEFEGKTIPIAPGFKIIGTMNLIVNGQVFNLPEPIVDRASVLESYEVNPDILADYAF